MSRRVAVITGASSGIGSSFARRLAREGYDLVLVARREDRLKALAAEFPHLRIEVMAADLTNADELNRVRERVAIDVALLVNNAGFGTLGRFFETDFAAQDAMHKLHVMATMALTHAALAGMVKRGDGAVINVSSVAAFGTNPGNVSYCATKAWMNSFTEGIWLELKSIGSSVRVQALCPGFTHSDFHDTLGADKTVIPASLWTTAEDVVEASLRGLDHNKLFVIPGWRYRIFVLLTRFAPMWLRHSIMLRSGSRFRREKEQ
jgi:short-subunit dehydrogenase